MKAAIISAICASVLLSPCFAEDSGRDLCVFDFLRPDDGTSFIALKEKGIGLLPPETVAGSYVIQANWSPSGRYVAVLRKSNFISKPSQAFDPDRDRESPIVNLGIWDSKARTTTWVFGAPEQNFEDMTWLPGSDVMIVRTTKEMEQRDSEQVTISRLSLYTKIDAREKKATTLLENDSADELSLSIAPQAPYAVLLCNWLSNRPTYFWFITADAKPEKISLPEVRGSFWSEDGKTALFRVAIDKDGKILDRERVYSFDIKTKKLTELPSTPSPKFYEKPEDTGSPLVSIPIETPKEYKGPKINSLWLRQSDGSGADGTVLVAADSDLYSLSPNKNEIIYRSEGALFIRGIAIYPMKDLGRAMDLAKRAELMSHAREVGVAVMVYSNDYDGNLPTPQEFEERIREYCKDQSVLDGFHYCLKGGKEADIADTASTMCGYIEGPGGYAVVFADSHAEWLPELPK